MPKSLLKILFQYCVAITFFSPPVLQSKNFHIPGEKARSTNFHAFVGGDIHVDPQTRLKKSTMLIRNGVIEKIGRNIPVPSFYREWNCSGKTIYPGLIDPYNLAGKKHFYLQQLYQFLPCKFSSILVHVYNRNYSYFFWLAHDLI